jgi:beta-glucosidase
MTSRVSDRVGHGDRRTFPKGFLWGAATSAYQIEGAAHEDGRGESIWDRFAKTSGLVKDGSNGDVACDHYHRWREDIDLMKGLGIAAYRFSIAWPRVFPTGKGPLNERGLDFYSRLVDRLLERGMAPYVTLYHWDLPQALQDEGGWTNRATAERFVEYSDAVARRLGDRVKHWITHNEPWCAALVGHAKGHHAPGLRDWSAALVASHHLLLSHGLAVPVIRANSAGAEVGITLNLSPSMPASKSPEDVSAARHHDGFMNRWFLEPVFRAQYPDDMIRDYAELGYVPRDWETSIVRAGDLAHIAVPTDFLGVNYYNRHVARSEKIAEQDNQPRTIVVPPDAEHTDIGWEVYAKGIFEVLMRVHLEYRPAKILVTENGAAYSIGPVVGTDGKKHVPDTKRIAFLRDHLAWTQKAIELGANVEGYFLWSILDNYEWDWGYTQRFGITWVDYATQERIPKDSAHWYRRVIEENAVVE